MLQPPLVDADGVTGGAEGWLVGVGGGAVVGGMLEKEGRVDGRRGLWCSDPGGAAGSVLGMRDTEADGRLAGTVAGTPVSGATG